MGDICTGKNTGNQEIGSILGLPLTRHVTSNNSFHSCWPQFPHLFESGLDDLVFSVPSCSDIP